MANNRMYLVHIPSGKAVFIAKRMSGGWYESQDNIKRDIDIFLNSIKEDENETQDHICIAMENSGCKYVLTDWSFKKSEDGKLQFDSIISEGYQYNNFKGE